MLSRIPRFLIVALLLVTGPLFGQENEDWRLFQAPRILDVAASRDGARIVALERKSTGLRFLARERGEDGTWSETEIISPSTGGGDDRIRLLGLATRGRAPALVHSDSGPAPARGGLTVPLRRS